VRDGTIHSQPLLSMEANKKTAWHWPAKVTSNISHATLSTSLNEDVIEWLEDNADTANPTIRRSLTGYARGDDRRALYVTPLCRLLRLFMRLARANGESYILPIHTDILTMAYSISTPNTIAALRSVILESLAILSNLPHELFWRALIDGVSDLDAYTIRHQTRIPNRREDQPFYENCTNLWIGMIIMPWYKTEDQTTSQSHDYCREVIEKDPWKMLRGDNYLGGSLLGEIFQYQNVYNAPRVEFLTDIMVEYEFPFVFWETEDNSVPLSFQAAASKTVLSLALGPVTDQFSNTAASLYSFKYIYNAMSEDERRVKGKHGISIHHHINDLLLNYTYHGHIKAALEELRQLTASKYPKACISDEA